MSAEQIPAETLAKAFHETYERLAPEHGYRTREASAKPWAEVPENNKALMVAVCAEILDNPTLLAAGRKQAAAAIRAEALRSRDLPIWESHTSTLIDRCAHIAEGGEPRG